MFTGVIHHIGIITACSSHGDWHITVTCDFAGELKIGDSVACNGACMTVVEKTDRDFTFHISQESLHHTAPRWQKGCKLHLERAMRLGDTLDGHLVSGHVDGLATLISVTPENDSHRLVLETKPKLARYIASKGSVTLDGVSLTVNEVDGNRFGVNIIPHTWEVTTFREREINDTINLEIDLIARYVERLLTHDAKPV